MINDYAGSRPVRDHFKDDLEELGIKAARRQPGSDHPDHTIM